MLPFSSHQIFQISFSWPPKVNERVTCIVTGLTNLNWTLQRIMGYCDHHKGTGRARFLQSLCSMAIVVPDMIRSVQGIHQACLQAVQLSCAKIATHHLPVTNVRMQPVLMTALNYMEHSQVTTLCTGQSLEQFLEGTLLLTRSMTRPDPHHPALHS